MIRRILTAGAAALALAFALQGCFWYVGDDGHYHHRGYDHRGGGRHGHYTTPEKPQLAGDSNGNEMKTG
jgi:hypothetical protein